MSSSSSSSLSTNYYVSIIQKFLKPHRILWISILLVGYMVYQQQQIVSQNNINNNNNNDVFDMVQQQQQQEQQQSTIQVVSTKNVQSSVTPPPTGHNVTSSTTPTSTPIPTNISSKNQSFHIPNPDPHPFAVDNHTTSSLNNSTSFTTTIPSSNIILENKSSTTSSLTAISQQQQQQQLKYLSHSTKLKEEDKKQDERNTDNDNTDETSSPITIGILGPIFYNLFVPNIGSTKLIQNAIRIANEQMIQRNEILGNGRSKGSSLSSSSSSSSETNSTVLYTLIGYPNILIPSNTTNITTTFHCEGKEEGSSSSSSSNTNTTTSSSSSCIQREYLKLGDEVNTNYALWEYCQLQSHQNHIVTYIHNRGSFHPTPLNEKSRRFGTKAALECRSILQQNLHQCNICTSIFHFLPQYLSSSNMWTAHCSYIRKLYNPLHYSSAMETMYNTTLLHPMKSQTIYKCLKPTERHENYLGLNRYAPEHWPFSHPDVEPCSLIKGPVGQISGSLPQKWKPQLNKPGHITNLQGYHKGSYSQLVGRLYEWKYIYNNSIPKKDSWIWKSYEGHEYGHDIHMEICLKGSSTKNQSSSSDPIIDEILTDSYNRRNLPLPKLYKREKKKK